MTDLDTLPEILLMGPGPSAVPPQIYHALSRPTLGHLDPVFLTIMDEIKENLGTIYKAPAGSLTIPLSGTGSSGMEAAFANLVEPGDKVLVLINGVFGMRMQDVATRLRAEVDTLEFEWGTPVIPAEVKKKLANSNYDIVAVVHAETSTGVANPVAEISALLDELPERPLYLVDCVTSFGGMEVDLKKWQVDAAYSGTQKCLSCPPGLSPFALSPKAVQRLKNRKTKVPNWYLDVTMLVNYWEAGGGGARVYHHTAPINMLYGLHTALRLVLEEGLEKTFARHREAHSQLVSGLAGIGLEMFVDESCRLPMLNSVKVPDGVDEAKVRKSLREEFQIEIGPGLGPLAGKIWRIGLMGYTARPENVERVLSALQKSIEKA
ncbi:MAG: alanine--glyoxylate aminotransferase family protein [Verrucomicrobiales bacterium]|nr:alanine--glyoxylate aminotransferase family protein [Verrucomicrobiales bacterium]